MSQRRKIYRFLAALSLILIPADGSQRSVVLNLPNPLESIGGLLFNNGKTFSAGFYYGLTREVIGSYLNHHRRVGDASTQRKARPDSKEIEATDERRKKEFEAIGKEVEQWAEELFSSRNDDGDWREIRCHPALKRKFNSLGNTQQFVQWMKDPRGQRHGNPNDVQHHPCMKLQAVIDAPFELVCRYLSQEHRYREYNSLLVDQKDIEELTPHSKICWSQSKKLLFIQPRDFVTYCQHRWLRDGSQLIASQACEHPDSPRTGFRAYGFRGATIIQRHPTCPESKTRISMLAHCSCGNDVPEWGVRAAVKVLAPIKPFEIIHRIQVGVHNAREHLEQLEKQRCIRNKTIKGRSPRPAGIAQMGYGCFWPNGGGLLEEEED